jgi:hypothetical protein
MDFLKIKYTVSNKKESEMFLAFNNRTYVNFFTNINKDKYLINGFNTKKKYFKNIEFNENQNNLLDDLYLNEIGAYKLETLKTSKYKIIDSTSAKIIKDMGYEPDIFNIYGNVLPSLINNREEKANLDISNFRLRMSEVVSHFMYNQIQQSIASFKKNAKNNSNAQIEVQPNFIINNLQGAGIMQYTRSVNPLEELLISTKVTKKRFKS